ncbi:hypothetical protein BJV78DRAFT_1153002 [Lactifluus subvellereus]|nr:hypothetical protein BJV78DRAFT_1153002 [Lactifluus subvellereus]
MFYSIGSKYLSGSRVNIHKAVRDEAAERGNEGGAGVAHPSGAAFSSYRPLLPLLEHCAHFSPQRRLSTRTGGHLQMLAHVLVHVQVPGVLGVRASLDGIHLHYRTALVPQLIESNLSFGKGRTGTSQKSHAAACAPTPLSAEPECHLRTQISPIVSAGRRVGAADQGRFVFIGVVSRDQDRLVGNEEVQGSPFRYN